MQSKVSIQKRSRPWHKVWRDALFQPTVSTYEGFLGEPNATLKQAIFWLTASGLLGGFISPLLQPAQKGDTPILMALCGAPFLAIIVVLCILGVAGVIHLISRAFGRIGKYSALVYELSTFNAPITLISSLIVLIPYGLWINVVIGVYWVVLTAVAIRAVYAFDWKKVMIALSPMLLLFILLIVLTPMANQVLKSAVP